MKRIGLMLLLLGVPALPAHADTCLSQSSTPTFEAGQSVPTVCDTHGSQKMRIVDSSGTDASLGGGTQYTEGDVDASITGNAVMWEDTSNTLVPASATKPLPVNIISGAGSGGTAMTDDAAFTPATTSITPAGAMFDDVAPDSVNEGDGGVLRMSGNRNLYTTIRDAAGNERGMNVDANGAIAVGSVPGTGVEDAAETAGGTLYMLGSVRRDTAASSAGTTGDNATINTDGTGRMWTRPTGGVTPADNFATPTDAITVWSLNGCYDGAAWDLCVKGTAGAGAVDANTARTAEATDSQLSAGVGATTDAAVTAGSTGSITGKLRQISSDIDAIKTAVQLIDDDQTGASVKHFVTAGVTEDETEVKGSAGRLLSIQVSNSAATVAYLRCADQVAASTTPGTTAVKWGMAVPGSTTGAGLTANFGPMGIAFSTGITCWVVGGKAETDVAEVAANDVQVNIQYK